MADIVSWVSSLVGVVPEDASSPDMVVWVVSAFFLFFLLCELFAFLHNIFRNI